LTKLKLELGERDAARGHGAQLLDGGGGL